MAKSALENMVPAWTNLVSIVVTLIVTGLGVYYSMLPSKQATGFSAGSIAYVVLTYIPHIMLLFGVLADMFTYEGVYSIPSLVGLLSIFVNYIFQYFWKGLDDIVKMASNLNKKGPPPAPPKPGQGTTTSTTTATTPGPGTPGIPTGLPTPKTVEKITYGGATTITYDGCNVQGFEGLKSPYAPQTLVVTATVFFYYIFDLLNNRGLINSLASILIGSMLFIGEAFIIDCYNNTGVVASALRALVEGAFFGGTAYTIVQTYYPARLPSAAISPFPRRNPSDLKAGEDGRMYDSEGNAYIILPNGQTVPDLSKNTDRQKMAEYVGENLGAGLPAKAANCPS
jgi:hypothetical protein